MKSQSDRTIRIALPDEREFDVVVPASVTAGEVFLVGPFPGKKKKKKKKKKKDLKEKSGDFVYVKSRNPLNGIAKVSLRVRRRLASRMNRLSEQARPRLSLGRGGRKRGDTL